MCGSDCDQPRPTVTALCGLINQAQDQVLCTPVDGQKICLFMGGLFYFHFIKYITVCLAYEVHVNVVVLLKDIIKHD